jgi:hypothetical protein
MAPDEFKTMLAQRADTDLLPVCLNADDAPFICAAPDKWAAFRKKLTGGVDGLSPGDIRVVGSGRHGFSMKPRAGFKVFDDDSDIDVAVVNETVFDQVWLALLVAAYPRYHSNQRIAAASHLVVQTALRRRTP